MLAFGALLTRAPFAHATFPGANGGIAYTDSVPTIFPQGNNEVFVMDSDGSNQTRVTWVEGNDSAAHWSPDGRKLLFLSERDGNSEIYSMNTTGIGGLNETRLTNDPAFDAEPQWSPDGTKIAFVRSGSIYVMNADGDGARLLAAPGLSSVFTWSPDGQKIAFSNPNYCEPYPSCADNSIWTINVDGSGLTQVTPSVTHEFLPAWSPDGTKIAYTKGDGRDRGAQDDVYVINADGTGELQLTNTSLEELRPTWSPNSQTIAFDTYNRLADDYDIHVVNADGSGSTNLTDSPADESRPVWSPDGTRILFNRRICGPSTCDAALHVMNPDGSGQTRLAEAGGPVWQALQVSSAQAAYDHPRFATPLKVSLVPAFRETISTTQCGARGGAAGTHGAPLAFDSCNPPAFTPGTTARLGVQSDAYAQLGVIYANRAATGDQANVSISAQVNDVRTPAGADYNPSPSGADVTLAANFRITDRQNGSLLDQAATTVDFDYRVPVACAPTTGPEGSSCAIETTADALAAATIRESEEMVIQAFTVKVRDSGANGNRGDSDDRNFATQGLYVP